MSMDLDSCFGKLSDFFLLLSNQVRHSVSFSSFFRENSFEMVYNGDKSRKLYEGSDEGSSDRSDGFEYLVEEL